MINVHMQNSMRKKPSCEECGSEGDQIIMHQSEYFIILIQTSCANINRTTGKEKSYKACQHFAKNTHNHSRTANIIQNSQLS